MARRLQPEVRRAEIIRLTRTMIAEQGPRGLGLRSVARYCGMSAPGVLRYFDGMKELLEAVIAQRDADEAAGVAAIMVERGPDATLRDLADALVEYIAGRPGETRNFDALEAEAAASVDHPAHDYYLHHQPARPLPVAVALAEKEYSDPVAVITVLSLVADGMRLRWLLAEGVPDYRESWVAARDAVFERFEQLRIDPMP